MQRSFSIDIQNFEMNEKQVMEAKSRLRFKEKWTDIYMETGSDQCCSDTTVIR